jgi:PAS domain S-box-containing protein
MTILILFTAGVAGSSSGNNHELRLTAEEKAWLAAHPSIRIRISRNYPPFEFFKQGHFQGLAYDHLVLIGKQLGIEFQPTPDMPWKDALESIKSKNGVDAILMITYDKSRESYLEFTRNYLSFPQVIITRKDSKFVSSVKDLAGGSVTTENGFIEAEKLRVDVPEITVIETRDTITSLETVATGKADGYVGNLAVASYLIEKNGLTNLKIAAPSIYPEDTYAIGVRKDWPELARIMDKALAAIPREEHQRIDQKWLSVRYEHGIRTIDVVKWVLAVSLFLFMFIVQLRRMVRKRTMELKQEIGERKLAEEALRTSRNQLREQNIELTSIEKVIRHQLAETLVTQKALKVNEDKFRAVFDHSPAIIFLKSFPDGVFYEVNQACIESLGYTNVELLGKSTHELGVWIYPEDRANFIETLQRNSIVSEMVTLLKNKDGTKINVLLSAELLEIDDNRYCLTVVQDITKRLQLEEQLRQQQKLESIGTLAGGIAHDFNNILTPIMMLSEMSFKKLENDPEMLKRMQTIHESAIRGASLTHQILAFSRKQVLQLLPLNLNNEVEGMLKMLSRLIPESIAIELQLTQEKCSVKADSSQMQQVILNLVVNARDAMPDGGRINISTELLEIDEPRAWTHGSIPVGRYVQLSITDTGKGMDAETRKRLFEPFYTTKGLGCGTGLGLSTVYGIIKQHSGEISVYSELNIGSSFRVYIPFFEADTTVMPAKETAILRGFGEVLLVEDDGDILELTKDILTVNGYSVTTAPNGLVAVQIARTLKHIDLLLTDVVIPGMNGKELHQKLVADHPDVKVLFMSGYPAGSGSLQEVFNGSRHFLAKPFSVKQLLEKVAEIMAGNSNE